MNCIEIKQNINEIIDNDLSKDEWADVHAHLSYCNDCQIRIEQEQKFRQALSAMSVPKSSQGFFDAAMSNAVNQTAVNQKTGQDKRLLFALPLSIAAGFALWFSVGVMFDERVDTLSNEIAGVKISLHEVRTVNLLFESMDALSDVQLSLLLPVGVELVDFPGQQEVVWHTNLNKGKNLLTLKLIGKNSGAGELVAILTHASKHKTLKVKMTVEASDQSLIYRLQSQLS